ncbi:MAG: hypothetical protein LBI20_00265 [Holosporales bacterium]|jgi:hypothetical protein|nr:hypothetical protein [Holosporales bacterium]
MLLSLILLVSQIISPSAMASGSNSSSHQSDPPSSNVGSNVARVNNVPKAQNAALSRDEEADAIIAKDHLQRLAITLMISQGQLSVGTDGSDDTSPM